MRVARFRHLLYHQALLLSFPIVLVSSRVQVERVMENASAGGNSEKEELEYGWNLSPYTPSEDERSSTSPDDLHKLYNEMKSQKLASSRAAHQVSYRKKTFFLAAWFFLNLALTLSNKAVLGQVCSLPLCRAADLQHTGSLPLASHHATYRNNIIWLLVPVRLWLLETHGPKLPRPPRPSALLSPLYPQYRHLKCLTGTGFCSIPSDHALHVPGSNDLDL